MLSNAINGKKVRLCTLKALQINTHYRFDLIFTVFEIFLGFSTDFNCFLNNSNFLGILFRFLVLLTHSGFLIQEYE